MKIPYNDLRSLHEPMLSDIRRAIDEVIASCQFIGNDRNTFVDRFETSFAQYAGASHCIGCSNGTEAIELVLRALEIGHGDEVIVPAQTWFSTAEAVHHVGAQPVFADIHPETFTLDPKDLGNRISDRTKAIIPVHLYGLPADMDGILEVAASHSLAVVEDCAQAHGATYKGKPVGSMGIAGTFSFYPGKNLGAMGEAGGIVTHSDSLREALRSLRDHGRIAGGNHDRVGRNARLDGIQAAILETKLAHLAEWTNQRQTLGAYYRKQLNALGVALQSAPEDRTHVYHVLCIQVEDRNGLRGHLDQAGIQTGVHYPIALPFLKAYSECGYAASDYPVAHAQASKALSLPLYPGMTFENIDYVLSQIEAFTP